MAKTKTQELAAQIRALRARVEAKRYKEILRTVTRKAREKLAKKD